MFSLKNILAGGPGRTQNAPDVFEACAPKGSGVFFGFQPLGLLVGRQQGHTHEECIRANNWVKTLDSGAVATVDGYPSILTLTTAASANTGPQIQISKDGGTTAWARFKPTSGYNIYLETLLKLSDVLASGFLVGLAPVDTTLLDASSAIAGNTAFLGFYKADAAGELKCVLRNASTSTLLALNSAAGATATLVNDTYVTLGMRVNSNVSVDFFYNGFLTSQTTLTNLPSVDLALSVAFDSTAASAKTATIRRIECFQEAA